jgi:hypothetical protein
MRPAALILLALPFAAVAALAPLDRAPVPPDAPAEPIPSAATAPGAPARAEPAALVAPAEPDHARAPAAPEPAVVPDGAPASEAVPPVHAAPTIVRVPDLAGLLLQPGADEAQVLAFHAGGSAETLARASFRLERLLEAFQLAPGASPVRFLLPSDVDAVALEQVVVARLLNEARPPGGSLLSRAEDRPDDYASRYAEHDSERLHFAAWRIRRAVQEEADRELARRFASGDYEVVPLTLFGT